MQHYQETITFGCDFVCATSGAVPHSAAITITADCAPAELFMTTSRRNR